MKGTVLVFVLLAVIAVLYMTQLKDGLPWKKQLKDCDQQSESGYVPTTWGPHVWHLLHTVAAAYPPAPTADDQKEFYEFIHALAKVLPCGGCRTHFTKMLHDEEFKLSPLVLRNRMSVFEWSVRVHNAVNSRLNKSVDTDVRRWFDVYAKNRADAKQSCRN